MGCGNLWHVGLFDWFTGTMAQSDQLFHEAGLKYTPFSVFNFSRFGEYWNSYKHSFDDMRRDREAMITDSVNPRRIIYGRTCVGGQLVYAESTGLLKELFHMIVVISGDQIDGFEEIWLDDQLVATVDESGVITPMWWWVGSAYFHLYDGTQTTACADMVSKSAGLWTDNHILRGCAYLHVALFYSEGKFPAGVPSVKVTVRGKRVYDPRTGLVAWSDNPALCILDYMTLHESEGGMGCRPSDEHLAAKKAYYESKGLYYGYYD